MRLRAFACVGFVLLLVAGPAAAQWKWKDGRGQVVVSDLPPPRDVPESSVLQRPDVLARRPAAQGQTASAPAAGTGGTEMAAAKPKIDPELEARKKRSEQEQNDRTKAEEQKVAMQRAENCKRARSQISTLESGMRMARTNENGEREILDDKQRAEEVARARQAITSDCR